MAFVFYDRNEFDLVSFHQRKDFRDEDNIVYEYIDRGDTASKLDLIDKHMNTKVKDKRPETPAFLIIRK